MSSVLPVGDPIALATNTFPVDLIWRVSVERYHDMIRRGVLTDDDPVELLEGCLVYKMPRYPRHTTAAQRARRALENVLPKGWHMRMQEPITTHDSEPEPDVAVAYGTLDDYEQRHPGPSEISLLIEVADSTLERGRVWKKRLYARSLIPVYWIINLVDRQVEAHSDPSGPAPQPDYRQGEIYVAGQSIPLIIAGQQIASIAVDEVLA